MLTLFLEYCIIRLWKDLTNQCWWTIGGEPFGVFPFFIVRGFMKEFTTYEEQINILKSRNLIIDDEVEFEEILKDTGYYNLINGYSSFFKDEDDIYIRNTSSDNIKSLYDFDKKLRDIVYKYAMLIESRFKSLVSYTFSKYHGENHLKYLMRENFDKDPAKEEKIAKLINECYDIIKACSNKESKKYRQCIGHYVTNYGFVPLWVLIRAMTFGDVSIFYANMTLPEKTEIAKEYGLKPSQLEIMIKMLVSFRNAVAHDERIFCKRLYQSSLPTKLKVYDYLQVPRNDHNVPIVGRNDFYSLIIIFKYLLKPLQFADFWCEFILSGTKQIDQVNPVIKQRLLKEMGFWKNWKGIKNFKNLENN